MMDISTKYLGLVLKSPLVVSSCPLCESVGNIRALEDAGVGAIVLPSLFEEQLALESQAVDYDLWRGAESFPEALSYFPEMENYNLGPEGYLELIRGAKRAVRIPVAVKLSPFFSAMAHMGQQLDEAGADALVLFNRFYQPQFDIDSLEVVPSLTLSRPEELLLRLHWVAILFGNVKADLAITGGVHSAQDVLKSVMSGASTAMMASALLQNGISHAATVLRELTRWMEDHEYESIRQMWGSMSQRSVSNPAAFERSNYMRVLSSYTLRPDIIRR